MLTTFHRAYLGRWNKALGLILFALSYPAAALAQAAPPGSGCGNGHGFNLATLTDTIQYIAGIMSGQVMKYVIIIAVGITVMFLFFSGDGVANWIKIIVGIIVGVIFVFALFAWITGLGNGGC